MKKLYFFFFSFFLFCEIQLLAENESKYSKVYTEKIKYYLSGELNKLTWNQEDRFYMDTLQVIICIDAFPDTILLSSKEFRLQNYKFYKNLSLNSPEIYIADSAMCKNGFYEYPRKIIYGSSITDSLVKKELLDTIRVKTNIKGEIESIYLKNYPLPFKKINIKEIHLSKQQYCLDKSTINSIHLDNRFIIYELDNGSRHPNFLSDSINIKDYLDINEKENYKIFHYGKVPVIKKKGFELLTGVSALLLGGFILNYSFHDYQSRMIDYDSKLKISHKEIFGSAFIALGGYFTIHSFKRTTIQFIIEPNDKSNFFIVNYRYSLFK
jgi:hypothetical protein